MSEAKDKLPNMQFDSGLCTGCANCVKSCPTEAIRITESGNIRIVDKCIECGECIRRCSTGAISPEIFEMVNLDKDKISVAIVPPVLYAQFPNMLPVDVLLGLKMMGFQHTVDLSNYLEMFQFATEEFIARSENLKKHPRPLISPICPVVIRLIAFKFPNLLPHILPIKRPVYFMTSEIKKKISLDYGVKEEDVNLQYISPCSAKIISCSSAKEKEFQSVDNVLGINCVFTKLFAQIEEINKADLIPFSHSKGTLLLFTLQITCIKAVSH